MIKKILFLTVLFNCSFLFGQYKIELAYNSCKAEFDHRLNRLFGKQFAKSHFKANRGASYINYVDFETYRKYKVLIPNSDSVRTVPQEYVMIYDIIQNNKIISSFRVRFHYSDVSFKPESGYDYKDFLKPELKVLYGKAISLDRAINIAKKKGYNISEWEIDYEKNKENDYKRFFPRLIWTLKQALPREEIFEYRVVKMNAKNGRILKEYYEKEID